MGLAASQARYLALTARRSDLEYQSQTINSRRIQLSYKTAEIAREYSDGMNNSRIKIAKSQVGSDGKTTNTWEELSFSNLLSSGYMLIGSEGTVLDPNPYLKGNYSVEEYAYADLSNFPDSRTYDSSNALTSEPFAKTITAAEFTTLSTTYPGIGNFYEAYEYNKDNSIKTYTLKNSFTDKDSSMWATIKSTLTSWSALPETDARRKFADNFGGANFLKSKTNFSYSVNPNYGTQKGQDIQSLLVSGKAQIVTKEFYDYLVGHGHYSPTVGLTSDYTFYQLMEMFETDTVENYAGHKAVIDWRSDETDTFESRTYTEDDEKVLAKYEADTAKVQALDKQLEMEEKNIETQHKAVETELENLKKVIQKNIEDTFKIFS